MIHIRNSSSIVGNRNAGIFRAFQPILHFPLIQGASAAVYDQLIIIKYRGKFCSAGKVEIQFLAGMLPDPRWKLHSTDIIALPMMGAAFGNQDFVSVRQMIQRTRTFHQSL